MQARSVAGVRLGAGELDADRATAVEALAVQPDARRRPGNGGERQRGGVRADPQRFRHRLAPGKIVRRHLDLRGPAVGGEGDAPLAAAVAPRAAAVIAAGQEALAVAPALGAYPAS